MKLYQYENKNVEIKTNDGKTYSGLAIDYTPADENNREIESICIGNVELYSNEINSIRMI